MKALIQLLVVVLIVNAGVQAARSYYNFHQFQRDVHEQTRHGIETTTDELHERILDLAAERGHEMSWNDVNITRRDDEIVIDLKYVDHVAFVPRVYSRPWSYETTVQVRRIKPIELIPD